MKHTVRRIEIVFCVAAFLWLAAAPGAAEAWRVGQAELSVKCPMTIGGSFDAKTTALTGMLTANVTRPPVFDGTVTVDLRTLDTGIGLRNNHLREKYLEVEKGAGYDRAVLSEIDVQGLNTDAAEGKGSFTGSLMLHGVKKTVSGPVEIRKGNTGLRVRASFPVNLPDYNIAEPRYLGVGLRNTVQVTVTFIATQ